MTNPIGGPQGWWTYHGDPAHSGEATGGSINKHTAPNLSTRFTLELDGPVLSVPAVVDGYVYVGIANSHAAENMNGGSFYKISLSTGDIAATFEWTIDPDQGDTHGFLGMGCTPAVVGGRVYFSAFDGKCYCLDADSLTLDWVTDLRHADPEHNQPVTNTRGTKENPVDGQGGYPVVAGWSSPVVANERVYVGVGEGENPYAYGFVYCLDANTGHVHWVLCTCLFEEGRDNRPNELPADVAPDPPPEGFTLYEGAIAATGASVWSSIAYDPGLDRLFCATGNPTPDNGLPDQPDEGQRYSYGLLALEASTGAVAGFYQATSDTNYRPSDVDIDFGGSPTIFTRQGRTVVGLGCKNGTYFVIDAETLECVVKRQMLPVYNDGGRIETVDPHPEDTSLFNPTVPNSVSDRVKAENLFGTYSTAAVHTGLQRLYVGIGGNNYHNSSPGIDVTTTPFMRVMDWNTLADAWELDGGDPPRYRVPNPPMYNVNQPSEAGLSSPAVVNDVVFCSTSQISLYAFAADTGELLWTDLLGVETGGYNGGYGYCMGPAACGDYVVAGALVAGRKGGILRIYGFEESPS